MMIRTLSTASLFTTTPEMIAAAIAMQATGTKIFGAQTPVSASWLDMTGNLTTLRNSVVTKTEGEEVTTLESAYTYHNLHRLAAVHAPTIMGAAVQRVIGESITRSEMVEFLKSERAFLGTLAKEELSSNNRFNAALAAYDEIASRDFVGGEPVVEILIDAAEELQTAWTAVSSFASRRIYANYKENHNKN